MSDEALSPRTVSLAELRRRLLPLIGGWSWADDALNDLWLKGAPDPQASACPSVPPCGMRDCPHVRRVLLPAQFAAWWHEVAERTGSALSSAQAFSESQRRKR